MAREALKVQEVFWTFAVLPDFFWFANSTNIV